jgi:hypothetical protein
MNCAREESIGGHPELGRLAADSNLTSVESLERPTHVVVLKAFFM